MNNLGRKLTLLRTKFSHKAYRDQLGIFQTGYIVLESYNVKIIEIKAVPGLWDTKHQYEGWKAVTDNGKEFTCNWNTFPDDSITPTFY
jgi:hypothetical protein